MKSYTKNNFQIGLRYYVGLKAIWWEDRLECLLYRRHYGKFLGRGEWGRCTFQYIVQHGTAQVSNHIFAAGRGPHYSAQLVQIIGAHQMRSQQILSAVS